MQYAISTGHHLVTQAAEQVLRAGGNAIDVAIAAFVCSWVVEPCMSGPGGGGFAVIKKGSELYSLDFFTQTPSIKKSVEQIDFRSIEVDFGETKEIFHFGHGSIAVPGAIAGVFSLYDLGARLPMSDLFAHAIEHASKGHRLVPFQQYDMTLLTDILHASEKGRELFFPNGQPLATGDQVRLPQLADFLDYISREGSDAFYRGEVAHSIAEDCKSKGGHLTASDFKNYQSTLRKASKIVKGGVSIITSGLPSVGSKILESIMFHTEVDGFETAENAILKSMSIVHAQQSKWFSPGWDIKEGGTSHLNIIDKNGDAVSLSMSLGEGSGCFVKGTDIHLNNMLGEAALLPNGWHSWTPNIRLKSMMTPALALVPSKDRLIALGSGGASRIPFMIAQVIVNNLFSEMPLEESVDAARMHWDGSVWQAELGCKKPSKVTSEKWKSWPVKNLYFGGVHSSSVSSNEYTACGDGRRDGSAVYSN